MKKSIVPLDEHEAKIDKAITIAFFICLGITTAIMVFSSIFN